MIPGIGIGIGFSRTNVTSAANVYTSSVKAIVGETNVKLLALAEDAVTNSKDQITLISARIGSDAPAVGTVYAYRKTILGRPSIYLTGAVGARYTLSPGALTQYVAARYDGEMSPAEAKWLMFGNNIAPGIQLAASVGYLAGGSTSTLYRDGEQIPAYDNDPHIIETTIATTTQLTCELGHGVPVNTFVGPVWIILQLSIQLTADQRVALNAATTRYLSALSAENSAASVYVAACKTIFGAANVTKLQLGQDGAEAVTGLVSPIYSRVGSFSQSFDTNMARRLKFRGKHAIVFADNGARYPIANLVKTVFVAAEFTGTIPNQTDIHRATYNTSTESSGISVDTANNWAAGTSTVYVDGAASSLALTAGPHHVEISLPSATVGSNYLSHSAGNGWLGPIWVSLQTATQWTEAQRTQHKAALDTYLANLSSSTDCVMFDGNSIMLAAKAYLITQASQRSFISAHTNKAVASRKITDVNAALPASAAAILASYAWAHRWYVGLEGTNTLFSYSDLSTQALIDSAVAQIKSDYQTWIASAVSLGFDRLVFCTIPPSTPITVGNGREVVRQTINTWLADNKVALGITKLVNVSSVSAIDGQICPEWMLDPTDPTVFADGTHYTPKGCTQFAQQIFNQLP